MLARWLDRDGIGQILAPDEKAAKQPVSDESRSSIWQFLAPDANFAPSVPPPAPPSGAFLSGGGTLKGDGLVQCIHCSGWTPVGNTPHKAPNAVVGTPKAASTAATPFQTPPPHGYGGDQQQQLPGSTVESLVVSAAKDTAKGMTSPSLRLRECDKIFRFCANAAKFDAKLAKKLRNLLVKDLSLLHVRANNLGDVAHDGFTPLMTAASKGVVQAAEIIVEVAPSALLPRLLNDRDFQGRAAMHIAAEEGHMDMVLFLKKVQEGNFPVGSPPPLDLLGRTPLGRAITSPKPSARKRRKELEGVLFSPGDLSIFGNARPEAERMSTDDALQLSYGIADLPGMRVIMEDAVCTARFEHAGKVYWLFGVCDGHGDNGQVSEFIASNIPSVLQGLMGSYGGDWTLIWKEACLQVDSKLKEQNIAGGSTGVFVLVGTDLMVVANVGDSRAILVQESSTTGLEGQIQQMAVAETSGEADQGNPTPAVGENTDRTTKGPVTVALSEDHKPSLPEEQARVENAGMTVVPITFEEDGEEVTIHKVCRKDNNMLAVSRSFGDFEYKANPNLGPEEQAVIAVPEVRVQTRNPRADQYLVLACDGIWDVFESAQVSEYVAHQVQVRKDISETVLPEVGDSLCRESLNRGSRDNMTVVVVALNQAVEVIRPGIQAKTLDFASPRK